MTSQGRRALAAAGDSVDTLKAIQSQFYQFAGDTAARSAGAFHTGVVRR